MPVNRLQASQAIGCGTAVRRSEDGVGNEGLLLGDGVVLGIGHGVAKASEVAHLDGSREVADRLGRLEQSAHRARASRLAEDGDAVGVAAEGGDVLLVS